MGVGLLGSSLSRGRLPSVWVEQVNSSRPETQAASAVRSPQRRSRDLLEAETTRLLPGSGSVTQEPEYLLWQTGRCISQLVLDSVCPQTSTLGPAFFSPLGGVRLTGLPLQVVF